MPLTEIASSLLLFALFAVSLSGVGLLAARPLGLRFATFGEKFLVASGLGAGSAAYLVFALGALQLLTPPILWSLSALLLVAGITGWRMAASPVGGGELPLLPRHPVEWLGAAATAATVTALLLLALTPETGKDALVYHLAVPKLYLKHGGFYFIDGNIAAQNPLLNEMLFLLALFLKGDITAKLLTFGCLLLLLVGIRVLSRWAGSRFPFVASAVFVTIPTIFIVAKGAYIDLFAALYVLLAFVALMKWREGEGSGWLVASGIFAGFALSTKFTTIILPALGLLAILLELQRRGEEGTRALRPLGLFVLAVAAAGSPFYVRNLVMTGNPVYPFMYGAFGGKGWSPRQAELYDGFVMYFGMGRRAVDYLLLPWNLSLHAELGTEKFDGIVGPLFLAVVPLALWRPTPRVKWLLCYCGAAFFFWATTSQQIRFLAPVLLFLSVTAGYVLTRMEGKKALLATAAVGMAVCIGLNVPYLVSEFAKTAPLEYLSGREGRDAFLDRTVQPNRIYRFLDEGLPPGSKVYLVFMRNLTFLTDRECYSDYMFESYTLQQLLKASPSPDELRRELRERGFTHIAYSDQFVTGLNSMLSDEEKETFRRFREKYLTQLCSYASFRVAAIARP